MLHARKTAVLCALTALLAFVGCHDILSVDNPQAITNEGADNPLLLPAVAAGTEGDFHVSMALMSIFTGLLSDEFWHVGSWVEWEDVAQGRIRANWQQNQTFANTYHDAENGLFRARGTAVLAAQRFERVMGDTAHTSPLFITAELARAWTDLYLALGVCQLPPAANQAMVSDTVIFKQAADTFQALIPLIQAAHYTNAADKQARLNQAHAGAARANLMDGNYDAALSHALAVPAGFEYDAIFSSNSNFQFNSMSVQGNSNYNRSFTIRDIWYPLIDTIAGMMRDPYSGQIDPRIQLGHDNNNARGYDKGVDAVHKFFSIMKYSAYNSPIVISKSAEMNLIIAEVYWHRGDYNAALAAMNLNRAAAGLPPFTLPSSGDVSTKVRDLLLQERFAELFGTANRLSDIYRFNLVTARLGPGRATKLPLSRTEQLANPSIGEGAETCPRIS
jgi:SusD/RagB-like outer membrane lipoprotein